MLQLRKTMSINTRSVILLDRVRIDSTLAVVLLVLLAIVSSPTASYGQTEDEQVDAIRLFNEAQDAHESGDLITAIGLYTQAIAKFSEFPEAAFQRGIAQRQLGKQNDAETSFRLAVGLKPDWSLALISLATTLLDRNELTEAETFLDRAIELEPESPPALAAMADLKLRSNADPKTLAALLTKISIIAAKANPTTQILLAKAAVEDRLGRRNDARSTLEKILLIDPDHFQANAALIENSIAERDLLRSLSLLDRIESKHPKRDKDRILYLRASVLAADGKLSEAVAFIEMMSEQTAASRDLRSRIASLESADIKSLENVLKKEPNNASVLSRLCTFYRRDDPDRAMDLCRRANEVEPGNVDHAIGYSAALVQAKRFEEAVAILDRIILKHPENSTARANFATALFQLKRYEEAKKEFLWLNQSQPENPAPFYFLAIIYDRLTDYADALANYQAYLRIADPAKNGDEIDRINLRLPVIQKLVKDGKGRKRR